jgi:hypothetical protein
VRLIFFIFLIGVAAFGQTPQPSLPQPGQLKTISAPPLTAAEKFHYRVVDEFGFRGLIGNAVGAGLGQLTNTPSEWGQGMQGYSYRYLSGLGGTLTRQSMAWALESIEHGDPRYFPSSEPGAKARLLCAMKQTFWVRRDNGSNGFAYARVVSAFASGQLTNAWQPPSNNSVTDGLERAVIIIGVDAGENLAQEIFPFLRPKSLRNRHR